MGASLEASSFGKLLLPSAPVERTGYFAPPTFRDAVNFVNFISFQRPSPLLVRTGCAAGASARTLARDPFGPARG